MISFLGKLILVLDIADRIIYRVCPFIAAGVVIGSIYWTAVTYGALTIMQAVGAKEGLALMEQSDPLFLLIGLPTVPIMLILGRLVRWEEALLGFLNKNVPRVPIVKHLLPTFQIASDSVRPHTQGTEPPFSDPVSATRVLCGALIFPSMAVLFGKLLFHPVHSNLKKTFFVSDVLYFLILVLYLFIVILVSPGWYCFFDAQRSLENLLQATNSYSAISTPCAGLR